MGDSVPGVMSVICVTGVTLHPGSPSFGGDFTVGCVCGFCHVLFACVTFINMCW